MSSMQHAGRAAAFEREYPRLYERMWRYVRPRLASDAEAEDVVAETMLDGLRTLHNFDATKGSLEQWLFGVARHKLMAAWSGRGATVDLDDVVDVVPDGAPSMEVTTDLRLRCAKVMERIPAEMHPLIAMRFTEGMTFDEMAAVTGKSPAALRQSFSRAFRRVRSELSSIMAVLAFIVVATVVGYRSADRGVVFEAADGSPQDLTSSEADYSGDDLGLASSEPIIDLTFVWIVALLIGVLCVLYFTHDYVQKRIEGLPARYEGAQRR